MAHKLYTMGYQGWTPEAILAEVEKLGAKIFDVRYSPYSKDERFTKDGFKSLLGGRYFLCPAFGNRNYKGDLGTGFVIADFESGYTQLLRELDKQPVILMCACWKFSDCHRSEVARLLKERGIESEGIYKPKKEKEKRTTDKGFLFDMDEEKL